jgi:excisionase family DNA binding protein
VSDRLDILAARMRALAGHRPTAPIVMAAPAPPPPPAEPLVLTLAQAATLVGVHPRTLAKWPLPFVRVGRIVRVRRSDLEVFLDQHAGGPGACPSVQK